MIYKKIMYAILCYKKTCDKLSVNIDYVNWTHLTPFLSNNIIKLKHNYIYLKLFIKFHSENCELNP